MFLGLGHLICALLRPRCVIYVVLGANGEDLGVGARFLRGFRPGSRILRGFKPRVRGFRAWARI